MQTHWLFINVNIDDIACYACRIVASPNVVFQGSKASKRTAFYSHFLFKEAFTWWNCNKRKEVRYDRSIFSLNSYKLYRNDDRMFKTQVQSVFTSFIRSITVWASRSLSGMVFSIYEVVHVAVITKNYRSLFSSQSSFFFILLIWWWSTCVPWVQV